MRLKLLGQIPIVQSIREGGDEGKPEAANVDSPSAEAFAKLAFEVTEQLKIRNIEQAPTKKVKVSKK